MTSAWMATPGIAASRPVHDPRVVRGEVAAAHPAEDAVVARLERQVEVRQRPRRAVDPGVEQVVVHVLRLDRAEADPLDAASRRGSGGRGPPASAR